MNLHAIIQFVRAICVEREEKSQFGENDGARKTTAVQQNPRAPATDALNANERVMWR